MFSKKDTRLFLISGVLIIGGYLCMMLDAVPNGFGMLTLDVAPVLLLCGFILPVAGILGSSQWNAFFDLRDFRSERQKHIAGLSVFVVALAVYVLTLEPTASLWDCGEFIAAAYKLQVPHTPGTPLTLLVGRLFTMLAFGDAQKVAWCMNLMSAVFSALSGFLI